MNFRRILRRIFSFSHASPIYRKTPLSKKIPRPATAHLEALEGRVNPAPLFWPDLAPSTGGMPTQVLTGDFNGDGKVDYVAATIGSVTVGLNDGAGGFFPCKTITLTTTPRAIALGDLNADGKLDIVTANESSDSVSILLGDGSGGFKLDSTLKVGSHPQSVAVGFLEGPGDKTLDIVTANFGSNNVSVILNKGDGTYKSATNSTTGSDSFPNFVAVGDFNQDGSADLLTANSNDNGIQFLAGNGKGAFSIPSSKQDPLQGMTALGTTPQAIVVGDFNADGSLDFATANPNGNSVSVTLGNGDGIFQSVSTVSLNGNQGPQSLALGDFNGDSVLDLATANLFDDSTSILLGVATPQGNGSGKFALQTSVPVGAGTRAVAVADVNGDGKADLLTGNIAANTLSILAGDGAGGFAVPASSPVGAIGLAVAVGDLNNDGKVDLISANSAGQSVSVYLGLGNGTYGPGVTVGVGLNPQAVIAGVKNPLGQFVPIDFNGDGKADIATANFGDNTISVLFGHGDGTFSQALTLPTGINPTSLVVGDFNGKGGLDLAVANSGESSVSLFLGDGLGSFQESNILSVDSGPISLITADFNGDSVLDLATANSSGNTLSVLLGNGNASFKMQTVLEVGLNPNSVAAGDFNNDGIADLVSANAGENTLSVLFGIKGGGFKSAIPLPVGMTPFSVAVADFNGDDIPDIATSEAGSNSLSVLLSKGSAGTFQLPAGYSVGSSPRGIAIGDFDNDSKVDLVSVNNGNSTLSILLSKGGGSFKAASSHGTGLNPNGIVSGDFNGDGKIDLATPNFGDNTLTVLLSDGGVFRPGVTYAVGSGPTSIAAGDVNGDGILDLATANNSGFETKIGSGIFAYDISLLIGNADGTFQAKIDLPTGDNPSSVAFGDFNGDNLVDIIVANSGTNNLTLFQGNGNGTFMAAKTLPAGGVAPQSLLVTDLNGDAKADIVVATAGDNRVYAFLGNGDASFKAAISSDVGSSPFSVAVGDFNRDGKMDLVTANAGGNDVSLLLGNGDGKFKSATSLFSGAGPWSVTAGDLDGDGFADIAASNATDNSVSLLFGNGNGTFQRVMTHTVGSNPYGITWGDFDGDGRVDLATANSNSSNVSVLYNFYDLPAGIVNTVTTATFVEGAPAVFQVLGKGSPQPTFSITQGSLPEGLKLDAITGLITGVPAIGTATGSPFNFTVTASSVLGTGGSQQFSFTIQKTTGIAPKITSVASAHFQYGTTGSFTVVATGTPAPTFSISVGALPAGITLDPVTGVLSGKANAGVYAFTIAASNNILPVALQPFVLTVDQAALTITADNKTKVYGAGMPALSATVAGLVNGDTPASIIGLGAATLATGSSSVGDYAITATGTNPNYAIKYVDGNLSVTRASLAITAENKTKVYGSDLPVLTAKVAGLVNGDTAASIAGLGATTTATALSKVGDYVITPSGTNPNYEITYNPGSLSVTKAALTIAAENKTNVYGSDLPALTVKVTGLVNGDTTANLSGLGATTTATAKSAVGDYKIAASGSNPNYTVTLADGVLSVTKAALTITGPNLSKVYGTAVPALTPTVSGLVNGDTLASIGNLGATTSATTKSSVGDYKVSVAGANPNYDVKLVDGNLKITKASLTITAIDLEKTVNSLLTFTGLEFTTSAFAVPTDSVTKVTLTSAGSPIAAKIGKYDIIASDPTGTGLGNYDITFNKGTLSVSAVNQGPSAVGKTVTLDEDSTYSFALTDFGFSDPDGDSLKAVKITSLPAKGKLTAQGIAVAKNDEIPLAVINAGGLQFTPAKDESGATYATFQFQVRDNGGTVGGGVDLGPLTPATLTLSVTAVNDPPTVVAPNTLTVIEDLVSNLTFGASAFSDVDSATLSVVLTAERGVLTGNGNTQATGVTMTGAGTGSLVLSGKIANLNSFFSKAGNISYKTAFNDNADVKLSVKVTDPSKGEAVATTTIKITPVNDAPKGAGQTVTADEDTAFVFKAGDFPFSDADDAGANKLDSVIIMTLPASGDLYLNGAPITSLPTGGMTISVANSIDKGLFSFKADANQSGAKYTSFTFKVKDNGGTANKGLDTSTASYPFIINVNPVNDAPVITSKLAFVIDEGKTAIGTITATDVDTALKLLTFSISGGADAKLFSIDKSTGALSFLSAPSFDNPGDADKNNQYLLTIQASDGSLSDTKDIKVTVNNVNVAPVIVSPLKFSVPENALFAQKVLATDLDANTKFTFKISGEDAAKFKIDPATGDLSFLTAPDFEKPVDKGADNTYVVVVQVLDNGAPVLSDTKTLNITVTNVNEAPSITSKAAFAIEENKTAVGTITATDPDKGNKVTFGIVGGPDAGLFKIDATSGKLEFIAAPNFEKPGDANKDNSYQLTVEATDGSLAKPMDLTITVKNVNDAPTITSPLTASVPENTKFALKITAMDEDSNSKLSFKLSGDDASKFKIDPATGELNFLTAPDFEQPTDKNKDNKYVVVVQVLDNGTPVASDTETITISVTNENDPPAIKAQAFGIDEGKTAVGKVVATDLDSPNLTFSIASGDDAKLFQIDASGSLSFITPPDFEAPLSASKTNVYKVSVTVSDGELTATNLMTVNVKNVNPTITSPLAVSVAENTTPVQIVTGMEAGDDSKLTYKLGKGGDDGASFKIDSATGQLSFLVAPDFEKPGDKNKDNVYTVEVQVSDGKNAASKVLKVTVTNVNEAPSLSSPFTLSANENQTLAGTAKATDPDKGDAVNFSITGGIDGELFKIDKSTGKLEFLLAPNFESPTDADKNNIYEISVTATDKAGFNDTEIFFVTVKDVNEAPAINAPTPFNLAVTEDVASKLTFPANLFADQDAASTVTVTLTLPAGNFGKLGAVNGGGVTVGGTAVARTFKGSIANINTYFAGGNVSYTTLLNNTKAVALSLSVVEGTMSAAKATASLQITPVNDPPTLTAVKTLTGAKKNTNGDKPFEITYAMLATAGNEADVDGDPLSFRVFSATTGKVEKFVDGNWVLIPAATSQLLSAGEKIRWTPANNATGMLNAFLITAFDGELNSAAPVQVRITVA